MTCDQVCYYASSKQATEVHCRRWSLNWDTITPEIVVGSCPRSASDIDRMVDEAGISAIICLQASGRPTCFAWPAFAADIVSDKLL